MTPAINQVTRYVIDDRARIVGLRQLRRQNFAQVLDRIGTVRSLQSARVLDVGPAYGWFLELAAERGALALGIEPDEQIAHEAQSRGLEVRAGWFPDALAPEERFDLITFNDVLEHIPDVRPALAACRDHLTTDGILSINIPTAGGLGYRAATALTRVGVKGPYERFWQAGLPSPHVHYFPAAALSRLVSECGFTIIDVAPLTAVVTEGLWSRVHIFRRPTPISAAAYAVLLAASPILNRPQFSDIIHVVAKRA